MKKSKVNEIIKKKDKQPFFTFIKGILRLIFRKPKQIINLNETFDEHSVILSNHSAKWGPIYLEMFFPYKHALWGAHEMLENYKSRFKYLRDIYYMKKRGYSKFRATIGAGFEAIFSIFFYRGMRILPTYQDMRMINTINDTIKIIDSGLPMVIFPENSDKGYKEQIESCHQGCYMFAERYYRIKKVDVPLYPVYVHVKRKIIVIGKPMYLQELKEQGLNKEQIIEYYRQQINNLFIKYIKNEKL